MTTQQWWERWAEKWQVARKAERRAAWEKRRAWAARDERKRWQQWATTRRAAAERVQYAVPAARKAA